MQERIFAVEGWVCGRIAVCVCVWGGGGDVEAITPNKKQAKDTSARER